MSHRSQRGPRTGPWFAQPWEGDRRAKTLQPLSHSRAGFRNAVGAHPDFFLWWKSWLMALYVLSSCVVSFRTGLQWFTGPGLNLQRGGVNEERHGASRSPPREGSRPKSQLVPKREQTRTKTMRDTNARPPCPHPTVTCGTPLCDSPQPQRQGPSPERPPPVPERQRCGGRPTATRGW